MYLGNDSIVNTQSRDLTHEFSNQTVNSFEFVTDMLQ